MKYIRSIRRLLAFLRPMQIALHSAYTAFFLILSLFPSMLLLLGLLKYTPLGVRELLKFLEGLLPEALLPAAQLVVEASYEHASGALISLSAAAALWSASRGMRGLVQGLDAVYGVPAPQGYLRSRGKSMVYTLAFLVALVGILLLQVLLNGFADYLLMTTRPGLLRLLGRLDLSFLTLLILLSLGFTALYTWLPARRNRFAGSLPGGITAALGWLLSSKGFSVYMAHFAGYTNIFGSLYGLALGMLWLYFCVGLVFYCGVLNRILFEKKWQK